MQTILYLDARGTSYRTRRNGHWEEVPPPTEGTVLAVTNLGGESIVTVEVPRLFGKDRNGFLERQMARNFPDSAFRSHLPIQAPGSWRDRIAPRHEILFGISGSEIEQALVSVAPPLAGVWPASLLLARLAARIPERRDLFIALPGPGNLRIVFVKDGKPVLTRLVPVEDGDRALADEIARTRRYLENTHVLERGEARYPLLLLHPAEGVTETLNAARIDLLPLPAPWHKGLPADPVEILFDLALKKPPGQVAPLTHRIRHVARQLGHAAWAGTALCLLLTAILTYDAVGQMLTALGEQQGTTGRVTQLEEEIRRAESAIAASGIPPALLRKAIDLESREIRLAPDLSLHLHALAQALGPLPGVRIRQLDWSVTPGSACLENAEGMPEGVPTGTPAAITTADGTTAPPRGATLRIELALPATPSPAERSQMIARLSQQFAALSGVRVDSDPLRQVRGGLLSSTPSGSEHPLWCLFWPDPHQEAAS